MVEELKKVGQEIQKVAKDGFDATVRSFGETSKSFQAVAAEVTDYSKTAFQDGTRAFEQLIGAKSVEQAIEIQSQYAKKAYETHICRNVEARRDVCRDRS